MVIIQRVVNFPGIGIGTGINMYLESWITDPDNPKVVTDFDNILTTLSFVCNGSPNVKIMDN